MFCTSCGSEIGNTSKFCPECGATLNGSGQNNRNQNYSRPNNGNSYQTSGAVMGPRPTSIVAYMSWIGYLVSFVLGDREGAKFYMNQALVFNIMAMGSLIPFVGWFLWGPFMTVCFVLGVIWAANQEKRELPLIGAIHLID